MSFTQAEHLFAGISELGVNDLIQAFFKARHRHWHYGTPGLMSGGNTPLQTERPALEFTVPIFGTVTVEYELEFIELPRVNIFPNSSTFFPVTAGQFTIDTAVKLEIMSTVYSNSWTKVAFQGLCEPEPPQNQIVTFKLVQDVAIIVPTNPTPLEKFILTKMIFEALNAALHEIKVPHGTFTVGAYTLALLVGPLSEDNQFMVRGNAL